MDCSDGLTGSPWAIIARTRSAVSPQWHAAWWWCGMRPEARPLSSEADECRDPEPAEPDDEPGLSRPGLWNMTNLKMNYENAKGIE